MSPTVTRVRYERAREALGNDHPKVRALLGRVLGLRSLEVSLLVPPDPAADVGFWRARGLAGSRGTTTATTASGRRGTCARWTARST